MMPDLTRSHWEMIEEGAHTIQVEHATLSDGSKAFNVDFSDGETRVRFGAKNYRNAKAIARQFQNVAWVEVEDLSGGSR